MVYYLFLFLIRTITWKGIKIFLSWAAKIKEIKMLPPLRKLAFHIQRKGYCFSMSNPISWDSEYKTLQYLRSKYSWISFSVSLIWNALISAGAAYDLFVHFFISPRENYNIGIIGLHGIRVAVAATPIIILLLLCRHSYTLVEINALLALNENLKNLWVIF